MPLGMEVSLDPDHIVLDGDPVPPHGMGHSIPPLFSPGRPPQQLLSSCLSLVDLVDHYCLCGINAHRLVQ